MRTCLQTYDMMVKITNQLLAAKVDVLYARRIQDQCVENVICDFITARELSVSSITTRNDFLFGCFSVVLYYIAVCELLHHLPQK